MGKKSIQQVITESKKLDAVINHYEVLGIPNFSSYDKNKRTERLNEVNREVNDNDDKNIGKNLITAAVKELSNERAKKQYDDKLRQYLEDLKNKPKPNEPLAVGFPELHIEKHDNLTDEETPEYIVDALKDAIFFDEVKLNTTVSKEVEITNKSSGGILNGTVSIPSGQTWLRVEPKTFKQHELPKKIRITVNPNDKDFSLGDKKGEVIKFKYPTDRGEKQKIFQVLITTEGLQEKVKRLSLASIWIFIALYGILVTVNVMNNNYFIVKSLILFGSIYYLYTILSKYNKTNSIRALFKEEKENDNYYGLIILGFLLIFNRELLVLFLLGIGVLFFNKKLLTSNKNSLRSIPVYMPFIGIALYGLFLLQSPNSLNKFFKSKAPIESSTTSAPTVSKVFVVLKVDCNIRANPSKNGKILFVGKPSQQFELISREGNSNWYQLKYTDSQGEKFGYIYITPKTGQIITN